ncbi:MAG: peptidase M42 [Flavobacteriaceae bacterium CG_4_8_14_3_um_filter_34_10]|nr:MAG: peptidase M42 [Flavobacteriaceae bacterium CG2_30_34_30]PIQ19165.1 MAG: peptidase M42 [Flavobacteriaceae bacterium CG18_big_fil_WC_8_21_14_2_50_34_36]PIV48378.1 MAG: peptidase M42 [Flavobacteriaceae bacterium CG02_land_8_20_14_3_00_34_13]PIX08600.1 MAG: peptidase M42 [Flavobacteriaceae bacterium CG_4_8_14_3_um_filter_34_10]PIZ07715.1 MAG: peptidase M42 [Flavobacteriaceae bacterium CG_4_10_14_0_8_um_filter_34_31]PJC07742.1 MAG: peptidase M42 [Flavobacteriaceae bacterium CG_4_9_14_0_8_um
MAKSILNKKSLTFLESYLNNASPTGYEWNGQKLWMDYLKPYVDEFITDNYGTAVGIINPKAAYKVVIEGHADEISWYVNYITDNGLIYVIRNGGSDHQIATSKRVNIHTRNGIVQGVFGWPAIHTRRNKEKEQAPNLENICIDVGCATKEEVLKLGVHVGCVITYPDTFFVLNKNKFVCRALDNRMGGFMIAEVARLLKQNKKKLPFGLYITNSVQEEIGLRGAEMITNTIKPNLAIITDVCHDTTTPMIEKKTEGETKIGDGPVISYAPAVQNKFREFLIDTAEKNKIPFQRMASSRATGTDTDAFAYSNGGVPSALISLPLRYMHTTVEMVHREDVENVIKLIYESLLNLKNGHSFSYFE